MTYVAQTATPTGLATAEGGDRQAPHNCGGCVTPIRCMRDDAERRHIYIYIYIEHIDVTHR